ncbi:unnamed protein product [Rotaria sp. Silwood1]|nr:unnamed protein product [Rotaria sp. Silwood1]CAF4953354.1 unnamed protein product [Rotaria sp. Silwood1]CAF4983099.1 unnamed protein product [Rotaria sp. Silwood1]
MPLQFRPTQVFDETKHVVDGVAKKYLEKATGDVHHLVPIEVLADGNCLYNSIVLLMNHPAVTTSELRVRTIIELVTNENYYENMYSKYVGSVNIAIKAICKNYTFSELYEIAALCNILQCNIRSVYPKIDFQQYMAICDNVFTPVLPIIANCNIVIMWSNASNEKDAREANNGTWSPNHFVPLIPPAIHNDSNNGNQSTSLPVTPEKNTFKNNTVSQIRTPVFQSSPSRRLRTEDNIGNNFTQPIIADSTDKEKNDKKEQRQNRLEKKREQSGSSRMNETEKQQQIRLEKDRERSRSRRMNETEEQRQIRLQKNKERTRSSRENESEEQRQIRLEKDRERSRSRRMNETEEQHQIRLEKDRKRNQSSRTNESEEQHRIRIEKNKEQTQSSRRNESEKQRQIRLEQQRKRNQTNRVKKKLEKQTNGNMDTEEENTEMRFSIRPPWPEPIPRDLKETRLQQFLEQMSMPVLAEATCAVCNVRIPAKDSKKIPISKIPNIHLLKVSEELTDLIKSIQSTSLQHSRRDTEISANNNNTKITEHAKSPSTFDSPSFYSQNDVILYKSGLFQQNKVDMCVLCQKCHGALSKGSIPKFSAANNMWLGDIPAELQGLTIPEEKLISLYRHNSCIIKLHSPFHSTTTAQTALKGNCITFLQNVPNIINSLPLKLDDLCDTLKVIFIGARPPDRIHLKKVLTVRKKKIIQALQWLKKHNVLYQNVNINLENIAQLPEDDVPECIMSTLEQKLGDEEIQSERVGYAPDPLSDPTEHTTADTIPISNR